MSRPTPAGLRVSLAVWLTFVLAAFAFAACDRSASDRADAGAAPKPSAGTVSSNDKTDAAAKP